MNQLALLNDYLETIKNTKIAREYKIEQILKQKTNLRYELFKKQIPIFEYQDFKDYIQESKIKKDIIRPGKIKKFSASS
jgi:hypothetical protein